jgi:hypothetical protein
MLPHQNIPIRLDIPAVYLVRDGRDAVVSMAHQLTCIDNPGSDFTKNLLSIISPENGLHFGGWSKNVERWLGRADIIIRFEDLIIDPIGEVEKLRQLPDLDLPQPQLNRMPTFENQKNGSTKYPLKNLMTKKDRLKHNQLFFRKGKTGGWKDDMNNEMHEIFWDLHGKTMERLGYSFDGQVAENLPFNQMELKKTSPVKHYYRAIKYKYRILINVNSK